MCSINFSACTYEGTNLQTIASESQNELYSYYFITLEECKHYCNIETSCGSIERGPQEMCKLMTNRLMDSDPLESNDYHTTYFRKCGTV